MNRRKMGPALQVGQIRRREHSRRGGQLKIKGGEHSYIYSNEVLTGDLLSRDSYLSIDSKC